MLPDNRTKCCPHLAQLREYTTCGQKHFIEIAEQLLTDTDSLRDDLKPLAEEITKITIRVVTEAYLGGCLKLFSDLGLEEITRAAIPPNHQTKPDSLKE
jgi:hypothetical protein